MNRPPVEDSVDESIRAADEFARKLAEGYNTTVSEFVDPAPVESSRPSAVHKAITFGGSIAIGVGMVAMSIADRSVLGYVGGCVLIGAGFLGFAFWIARS